MIPSIFILFLSFANRLLESLSFTKLILINNLFDTSLIGIRINKRRMA